MPHDSAAGQSAHALRLACSYLDRRERTASETRAYLRRRGIEDAVAERVVVELNEDGYLDDARFARLFVSDKRELEGWGAERIKRGLLQRGIAPETVAAALAEDQADSSYEAELGRALELLSRRFDSPPRSRRDRDRALGVLIRKGYESEIALDALTAYARAE